MLKKVAIVQSSYIPWKGFFDLINLVDEFILYDDVQFTRRDWRNRNKIKTPNGFLWLTIPVAVKGRYFQKISKTTISDPSWKVKHWKSIVHNYAKAKYFRDYKDYFEDLFLGATEQSLSLVNHRFLTSICQVLGITTKLSWSMDYGLVGDKTERLINLCQQAGATEYISGPSAQAYLQDDLFKEAGVNLSYMDYSNYPEYNQLFPPFVHEVSILDLIFNEGLKAIKYMKSFESCALSQSVDDETIISV